MMRFIRNGLFFLLLLTAMSAQAAVWSAETRLTTIPGQSWAPRMAAYNGTLHLVWIEYPTFTDPEIYYSRSANNGNTWSAPQNISNSPGRMDIFPSIAANAAGVYVFWSSDPGNGHTFFSRSINGGSTWQAPQQLTPTDGFYSRATDILADSTGGLHLVWYDARNVSTGIYHRQSCDNGATWTAEKWVTQNDGIVDNEQPKIAQASDGTLYISFRSSRGGEPQGGWTPYDMYMVRGQNSGCPSGTTWMYPAQMVSRGLPDEYSNNYSGSIASGAAGRMHIAYWDERAGNNVVYRRGIPAASGWGAPVNLSGFALIHPQVEASNVESSSPGLVEDANGGVHLFFSEHATVRDDHSVGRLLYRSSADGGVNWGGVTQLGTGTVATSPQAISHNERVHLVWSDFRNNNSGSEIYYRYYDLNQAALPSLVGHYYSNILGRAPDAGGKTYWESEAARMQSLAVDIKEAYMVMADQFFNSSEYLARGRTDQQYVTDLYVTFFNRAPDAGGLSYWMGQLSNGSTRNMVMYFFLFSSEFNTFMTNLFGNTASRAEVYAVVDFYRGILGRLADNSGFTYWVGRFRTAQCSGATAINNEVERVSSLFVTSAEYASRNRTNAQYVQDLYYAFMRRSAVPSEVNYWINTLNTGSQTRDQLRKTFLGSAEFQSRVTAIINQGCLP